MHCFKIPSHILFTFSLLLPLLSFSQYVEYDWEERDQWMPVQRIFDAVSLSEGMHVADIGCHEGYLTIKLANEVGVNGQVYAVDVRADRLDRLKEHLEDREISNVEVILGDYDDPKLPKEQLDVVFIIDTYHEMSDYERILKKVYKALKPGGKLLILEKLKDRAKDGTRDEQTDAHTLSSKYVIEELKVENFDIINQLNDLGDWENDYTKPMWLVVGQKPDNTKWNKNRF